MKDCYCQEPDQVFSPKVNSREYLKFHWERRENSPVDKAVIKVVQLLEDCGEDLGHLGQLVWYFYLSLKDRD